jgi:hypothetical protein
MVFPDSGGWIQVSCESSVVYLNPLSTKGEYPCLWMEHKHLRSQNVYRCSEEIKRDMIIRFS